LDFKKLEVLRKLKKVLNYQIRGKSRICNIWLYAESNLQLKNIQMEPFDAIVCDGPYGILEPKCEWDNFDLNTKFGRERFRDYYSNLFNICLRYLKNSGSMFIFNYPEGASIIKSMLDDKYPVFFRRWISWFYDNHFDFDRGNNFRRSHESILYYTKQVNGFVFNENDSPDVIFHPLIRRDNDEFKDGAKPLKVLEYLLNPAHLPGGRLLSLFAGSGTDLIVSAVKYDMDAVGFEFNPIHVDIIDRRIKEYTENEI